MTALAFIDPFIAARLQMALTLGFHIILACIGVGLPVLILFAEWRYLKTNDATWQLLAKRWSKAFAVLFAVGAVSGTILSFELGLLWPTFMGTFGSVIALPFTLEAFAFFIEAIFVGIYLYSWDRLTPRQHWLCGFPIAIAGFASAWFVVTANAWMNTPTGFTMLEGRVVDVQPWAAMFNPATPVQTTHMLIAAYIVTGFMVSSVYGYFVLRGESNQHCKRAMILGFLLGACLTPLQLLVGDWSAKVVADTQPAKLAAMEGQFETETYAPLRIGGLPNEDLRETPYAIEIPGLLSFLAHGDPSAEVKGLNDIPRDEWPPVRVVHIAFQVMVGIGMFLFALSAWGLLSLIRKKKLPDNRYFLWSLIAAGPLSILAMESGWVVTEVGRQPWIVYGYMKTSEALTNAPGIPWLFLGTIGIYGILIIGATLVLRILARTPLPEVNNDA